MSSAEAELFPYETLFQAGSASDAFAHARGTDKPGSLEQETIALFDEFRAPVLRYLYSLGMGIPDAEEIAQEVFLLLFQHLRKGKSRDHIAGWIFRTAHNLVLKHRDRSRRQGQYFSALDEVPETADRNPGPDVVFADGQEQRQLWAIFRALPELDRSCLSLRAEGLRYRQIAEVLGISLGSVANSLTKSLERLARGNR